MTRHAAALYFLTQSVRYAYYFYFDLGFSETLSMFHYSCHNILRFFPSTYPNGTEGITVYTGSYRISRQGHEFLLVSTSAWALGTPSHLSSGVLRRSSGRRVKLITSINGKKAFSSASKPPCTILSEVAIRG